MKRTLTISAAICALLACSTFAFADLARPRSSPTPEESKTVLYTNLTVVSDPKASDARLQISRETLQAINEAAGNTAANQSMTQRLTHSSSRTIMAGLFMFLAVSFGGVWLARSNQRRSQRAISAVFLVAGFLGVATVIVRANAGPPPYVRWQRLPQALKDGATTRAGANVEIVPGDDGIKLIIPLRSEKKPGEE